MNSPRPKTNSPRSSNVSILNSQLSIHFSTDDFTGENLIIICNLEQGTRFDLTVSESVLKIWTTQHKQEIELQITMTRKVYINNHFHTHLVHDYNDRPEFHRHHEHSLWTIYQVLKAGNNHAVIVGDPDGEETQITSASEFRLWVSRTYPGFEYQLDKEIYTRYPHPDDRLK